MRSYSNREGAAVLQSFTSTVRRQLQGTVVCDRACAHTGCDGMVCICICICIYACACVSCVISFTAHTRGLRSPVPRADGCGRQRQHRTHSRRGCHACSAHAFAGACSQPVMVGPRACVRTILPTACLPWFYTSLVVNCARQRPSSTSIRFGCLLAPLIPVAS